jgi:phenylalanyl-tRNA synthetase beta chain
VELLLDGEPWGVLGEITAEVRTALELRETAHVAEVRLNPLIARLETAPKYTPLPTQPAMDRDINLVLDEGVLWETVEKTVRQAAGPLLEAVRFDSQYRGQQIPGGKKSYVVGLTYRAAERTLTADEVDASRDAVVTACRETLGAVQR